MTNSILLSTKEKLGVSPQETGFDSQLIDYINGALSTVAQLGIGPPEGYEIVDETNEWDDILVSNRHLNAVKSYVFLKVRMLFDPPTTGYLVEAMQKQITELEWRLNVYREGTLWVPPTPEEEP